MARETVTKVVCDRCGVKVDESKMVMVAGILDQSPLLLQRDDPRASNFSELCARCGKKVKGLVEEIFKPKKQQGKKGE